MYDAISKKKADIMVVDDVPANVKLLSELLIREGYTVRPATSGADALDAIRMKKPDLVLLDIRMPGMTGFEVCSKLHEDAGTADIPVIFVTASIDPEGAAKGLTLGAVDYINKPFREEEVLARVRTHVELYRMRRHLAMESKETKARYRRLVEGLEDEFFFYSYGVDGVFTYLSPSIENVLGYSQRQFITHYTEYLSDSEINQAVKAYTDASLRGEKQPSHEVDIYHKNGSARRLLVKETPVFDDAGQVVAVEGIAHDITDRILAERQRESDQRKLQYALQDTVQAISNTVEKRDPYTAGHQKRVAELACAIAREIGLESDIIEGIRMGGTIHDIGKIHIPTEILNRPGKLSNIELNIIKGHPETGFSIIKEVVFPWPVADIVYQHHERLDGSGYPQGLQGEEICIEARVLAVADAVEAMASHRPYRPALGIKAALEEIEQGSGRIYDPQAVTACLRLFREKGCQINQDISVSLFTKDAE
ncbi:MAG: HD domain-containing phosphohydrolase [Sedimenticola sp.]